MKTNARKSKRPAEAKTSRTAKRKGDYVQRRVRLWGVDFHEVNGAPLPENVELLLLVSYAETNLESFPVVARRQSNHSYKLPDTWWTGTPGQWGKLDPDLTITHWREVGDMSHWNAMQSPNDALCRPADSEGGAQKGQLK